MIDPKWPNQLINPLKDNILGRLDDFVLGMMAARLCAERPAVVARMKILLALAVLAVTGYGWNLVLITPRSPMISIFVSLLHLSFSLSLTAVVCRLYAVSWTRSPWLQPLVVIGQMCYSIYLIAEFILIFSRPSVNMFNISQVSGFIVTTLLFSLFCFVIIEARSLRRKPAWLNRFEEVVGIGGPREESRG
jgi:peptidoglycan/LPS O-acetylase OafA/YrhL